MTMSTTTTIITNTVTTTAPAATITAINNDYDGCCHDHGDGCNCGHNHNHEMEAGEARKELLTLGAGAALLAAGLLLDVRVGQTILVRPGEKVPLDGVVLTGASQLDTAALTSESVPRDIVPDRQVMAGCINLSGALEIKVEKSFGESTASKILEMTENAAEKKLPARNSSPALPESIHPLSVWRR